MNATLVAPPSAAAGPVLPRLLTAIGTRRSDAVQPLDVHRESYLAPPIPSRRPLESAIELIESSGLRGRGGAGFPTGRKLRTVSHASSRPVVVVNGSEGEPASRKDVLLLTRAPHLVIDGALHVASAVAAREVIICIERSRYDAISSIEHAISERVRAGEPMPEIRVVGLPSRYVAGEETALVHFINGGDAKPLLTPPRPFERGIDGRPTLINNVETLCHLTQIMRWGSRWFRSQGTPDEPGTTLLTLSGSVARAGVCEMPVGMSMHEVISAAGPTTEMGAVLLGGYYGTWVSAMDARWATLDNAYLRTIGSSLGCGAMIVVPRSVCGLLETARVLSWLAGQTAGQCGPCVHGLAAIASGMDELACGRATSRTVSLLHRWAEQVEGRGACNFPDGAVRLLRSALRVFRDDVDRHVTSGPCVAAQRPGVLAIPATTTVTWR
ncbi:MAG TPA: NADH-ubiquinone oxidoreductase-F iron-sulfur binding region domain-containing protein [Ilumatobacteraceae bacterium]